VALNCKALPATLLESELFGHERGAFAGAITPKMGRFQTADRSTLFLDEIGELPVELQPKLLRAIQEQEFERLGSSQRTRVDVRILSATNQNLEEMVAERTFRADAILSTECLSHKATAGARTARRYPLLVDYFLRTFVGHQGKSIEHVRDEVMAAIMRYDWPGNIRELQNFIEASVILTSGAELRARSRS
jgi:formate hydrogenlyase transcriptional activator